MGRHSKFPLGLVLAGFMLAAWHPPSGAETGFSSKSASKVFIEIPHADAIAVFDFESRRVVRRIDLSSAAQPPDDFIPEIAPAAADRTVYWIRHSVNELFVIDAKDERVVGRLVLQEKGPGNVTVAPDEQTVYIPHYQAKAVTIVDLKSKKQRVIRLPGFPGDIAVAPRGILLVTSRDSNQLFAIEESSGKIRSIEVGRNPVGVAVTPDGSRAFVSHDTDPVVAVIDLTAPTYRTAKRIRVKGTGGSAVAAGPDGKHVYVAHCCAVSALTVISIETMTVRCELPLVPDGLDPARILFSPKGDEVLVLNSGSMNISSFRPPCGQPISEALID